MSSTPEPPDVEAEAVTHCAHCGQSHCLHPEHEWTGNGWMCTECRKTWRHPIRPWRNGREIAPLDPDFHEKLEEWRP